MRSKGLRIAGRRLFAARKSGRRTRERWCACASQGGDRDAGGLQLADLGGGFSLISGSQAAQHRERPELADASRKRDAGAVTARSSRL
jgi:hypothetical protein